jgi:hypothetical protein
MSATARPNRHDGGEPFDHSMRQPRHGLGALIRKETS